MIQMPDSECAEKLLEILKNYQISAICARDLHKLSTDTVIFIYQELLKPLGVDIRNLRKPLKSETQFHLSHYDTDFRFIMKLYSAIAVILKEASSFEFDLMDILKPGLARTFTVVVILHNVILFRNSRKEVLDEIVEQASEKIEKFRKLAVLKEKLRDDINCQSKYAAKLAVQQEQLKNQINDAEGRIFTLIEERENITESIEPLSKTLAEYDNEIRKLETEGIKLAQTIENLKNQIVSSPAQLVQNLENLKATEQQKKEEEHAISEGLQRKKSHFENLANCVQVANAVMEEIKDINKLIDEIRNEEMELERLEMEKTKLTEEVSIKKEVIGWIKHTAVELQQQIKASKEHLAEKMERAQEKVMELDKKIAQKFKNIEDSMHTKQNSVKELEEYKVKITKEEEKQSYALLKIEKESEEIIQEARELIHAFNHLRQTVAELQRSKK
ncbi:kinetochore protein NUF2 homolog isoform X1 [Schistocerca americana]|uniref:kinetochore protein NUF2 homolog isoform X1 n=2 Tax=Schistocerca americana TaxID=7009 RepID=UPI001F4FFCD9|nr:kinetochore protein NUF2 homolog isoform X1 [Schistocerca americana]XP_049951828.1 uncharacterized protein LOC126459605 isoform X1 [Schistocerca serialis cubense]